MTTTLPLAKTKLETTYTSTEDKLLAGAMDRLLQFQKEGVLYPQSLQLAPEDKCSMDCTWCSTKWREHEYTQTPDDPSKVVIGEKKKVINQISFNDIKKVVTDLMQWGTLKTVELTGGGDPTMYRCRETGKNINDVIDLLHDHFGLQVGMITNGMGLNKIVKQEQLDKLTWLRCSLASFDPQNFKTNNDGSKNAQLQDKFPDLPKHIKGQLGFSYVWGPFSRPEILDKIADYAKQNQVDFVRVVPDCLNAEKQGSFRTEVGALIKKFNEKIGREVMFFQAKRYDVYPKCYVGKIKPFLNADGYFYQCSAVPLYNQAFTPWWRAGHLSEVNKIWSKENMKSFDTSKCVTGKCFYFSQNEVLEHVRSENQGVHKDFI